MKRLLVVAGEGSGDLLAAPVVARLGTHAFGLGGPRLHEAGTDLVADVRSFAAMGIGGPIRRLPALAAAMANVARAIRTRRPAAALLVGFSEPNTRIAPWLRARGVRVLWYAPPQVWAWRPRRASAIAASCDRMAVILPFELFPWRAARGTVDYVGHPALDHELSPAAPPTGERPIRVALLPGSRPHEVEAHWEPMAEGVRELRRRHRSVEATVVGAPALEGRTLSRLGAEAVAAGATFTTEPIASALEGHHVAVCSSGTATLECAALGVPPVIVYRTDAVTYAIARRLVRVPHVGLPNLVLGQSRFPELLQRDVSVRNVAGALASVLATHDEHVMACREVRSVLEAGLDVRTPADRVAAMLRPWLD